MNIIQRHCPPFNSATNFYMVKLRSGVFVNGTRKMILTATI